MPFSINKENLSIKARRGDSGVIVFEFNMPIDNFMIDFCISKRLDYTKKNDVIISKCYKNISGNLLEVDISSEETKMLKIGDNFVGQYFWSLKLHNELGFNMTLIPDKFNRTPRFFVYPKIGECEYGQ